MLRLKKIAATLLLTVITAATFTSCGSDKNGKLDCCGQISLINKGKKFEITSCRVVSGDTAVGTYTVYRGLYTLKSKDGSEHYAQWNGSTERYELS